MEEVNHNVEKRLSERETEMKIETKDESASRKEGTNRSVNLGQVLPLMQVSLRNLKLAFMCKSCWFMCRWTTILFDIVFRTRDFERALDVVGVINPKKKGLKRKFRIFSTSACVRSIPSNYGELTGSFVDNCVTNLNTV